MRNKQIFLLPFVVACLSGCLYAQLWSGVINPSRAIDWSEVGFPGDAIPTRTTVCSTLNPGATSAQIDSAIASCPAGDVVYLDAGTYKLSDGIDFAEKSNVTLRGAGPDKTFVTFSGSVNCNGMGGDVCVRGSNNYSGGPNNTANWTAGYTKGATQITLDSATNLNVGSIIILDQLNDSSDPGNAFVCETVGTCAQAGGGPAGGERENRAQQQMVEVTAITGTGPYTVTISPGLYMPNWRSSQSPGAWWASTTITGDGIESMSLDHTNSTSSPTGGIFFYGCYKCWVDNVRSVDAERNHVWLYETNRSVIRDNYFYGTQNAASQSYGVEAFMSSDNLIENNIFQHVTTPIQVNGSSSGSVYAYNFSINDYYSASSNWMIYGDSLHAAGTDNILFEGNQANGLIGDDIHGTHNFVTAFRNQYIGWETGKTAQTTPFQLYMGSRYFNLIGNVLGKASYHTQYQDLEPSGTNSDTSIYTLGFSGNGGGLDSGGAPNDTLVASTSMRWGNYDVVKGSVQWNSSEVPSGLAKYANAVPANHNLPASFYLSSKPTWWPASKPWPAIGPDVTGGNIPNVGGHAYTIPSEDCYANVMKGPADGTGGVLSFSASACYSKQAAPDPPTNLTASPN